jgi:protein-disulfide isomerase
MCARSLIDGRFPASFIGSEEIIMPQAARQGNEVYFPSKSLSITRRALANLVGLAALCTFAPLPLIGDAKAQNATGGLAAIEPVSLPDMALGPRNAPVTIVDYSSMTCSHCAAFMINVFPMLRSKYIDTGQVRFVFREFPLDTRAEAASMLARTIANDDSLRYFGAIDYLFKQQDQLIAQPADTLQRAGRQYGISEQGVETCLKDQALLDKITVDRKIANEVVKVRATPTFFINGQMNEGFMSFEATDSKIASLLRR